MDTYVNFHRHANVDERDHPSRRQVADQANRNEYQPKLEKPEKAPRWNATDVEKSFQPTFPSMQDLSDTAGHPQHDYLGHSPNSTYRGGQAPHSDEALNKIKTANSVTISPELFEKLYLNPPNEVKGELRKTFGNPTPLALLGFLLSFSPLCCELMGWRGAGGNGVATVGAYYFMGGFLMSLGGILEFFLGNTFSFVVFCSFGGFWFTLGSTLTPSFNAYGAFVANNNGTDPNAGIDSPTFHASFGFFFLFVGVMSLIYLICALRTNIVFVVIFFALVMVCATLTGSYWHLAAGNMEMARSLSVVSGAFGFLSVIAGWWIFFAQMLETVEFPIEIPVGDISHFIKPLSEVRAAKRKYPA